MLETTKRIYRKVKYSFFVTREKEYIAYHKKRQPEIIAQYFEKSPVRKLQIGAQGNSIDSWLNVDIHPKSPRVAYMDATENFPFNNDVFDYIFSEHMIEHISFNEGHFMLRECFRVLKRGGRIRISTPDLAFLVHLFRSEKSDVQNRYIEFSIKRYFKDSVPPMDTLVVNNFMRDWGHKFIHDEKSLSYLLGQAGFQSIIKCQIGESRDDNFRNVEQHGKEITDAFNSLESIVLEAVKPL